MFAPEIYGKASYAISIFSIALLVLLVGIPETFISWYVKKKDVSSVSYFLIFLSGLFVIIGLIIFWNSKWAFPLILVLPFFLIKGIGESFFRMHHKHHMVQFFGILTMFSYLLFLIFFKSLNELGILLSYSLSYVIVTLLIILLLLKDFIKIFSKFKFDISVIKAYVKKGLITAFISVSFAFLTWIDSSILGLLSTFENVAKYTVSGSIAAIIMIVPVAIALFLLTRSAEIKDQKVSLSLLKRTIRLTVSLALIFGIALVSFVDLFIRIFFKKYIGIEGYVAILTFGLVFGAVNHVIAMYHTGKLKPETIFYPILFAAILNVILDILFIPKYQIFGIIIATVISHFLAMIVLTYKSKIGVYALPTFLMTFSIIIAYSLGIYGLFVIPVVIPLLFLSGLFTKEDYHIIRDVIKEILRIT